MPNGNGIETNGTNGRFSKISDAIIGLLVSALFAILGYLYLAQNSEIESLRVELKKHKEEYEAYKIDHEKDKFQILIDLNTDLTEIKAKLGIDRKSTSRK